MSNLEAVAPETTAPTRMRASDLLVKALENKGVEYVLGVPRRRESGIPRFPADIEHPSDTHAPRATGRLHGGDLWTVGRGRPGCVWQRSVPVRPT